MPRLALTTAVAGLTGPPAVGGGFTAGAGFSSPVFSTISWYLFPKSPIRFFAGAPGPPRCVASRLLNNVTRFLYLFTPAASAFKY